MLCGLGGAYPVLTQVEVDSPYALLLAGYLAFGIALGLVYAPMSTAAMAAMPGEKVGIASGVLAMDRVLAGAIALAIVGAVFHALLGDGQRLRRPPSRARPGCWSRSPPLGAALTWAFVRDVNPHGPDPAVAGDPPPASYSTTVTTADSTSEPLIQNLDKDYSELSTRIPRAAFQSAFCHPSRRWLLCPGMSSMSFQNDRILGC